MDDFRQLQKAVGHLQEDDTNGCVSEDASPMAKLIIHIPRAASIVEEHHCGTPLSFLQAVGTKLQELVGTALEEQLDDIAAEHRSASFTVPETVAGVYLLSLARLFGLIDHFDTPLDFEGIIRGDC